jgi:hypothetical protein
MTVEIIVGFVVFIMAEIISKKLKILHHVASTAINAWLFIIFFISNFIIKSVITYHPTVLLSGINSALIGLNIYFMVEILKGEWVRFCHYKNKRHINNK